MEKYWCLRWLRQQRMTRCRAAVLKEDLVRLENAPLVTRVPGLAALPRGEIVELEILATDELSLDLECRVVNVAPEGHAGVVSAD